MPNLKPWMWYSLAGLLGVFLLLMVIQQIFTVKENFKSTLPKNTISMTGEAKVSAVPDLATVNIGLLTEAKTAKDAQANNVEKINKVVDFIKQQGIDAKDIATSQFNIYPSYDYANGKSTITGYQANQTVTVKVHGVDKSTDVLSKILDGSVANGANQINGVQMTFEDAENLRQEARKQAIDKAKQKAQELADQAGLKLGKVVSISESNVSTPQPMTYGMGGGGSDVAMKSSAPSIETGSQDITALMTVVFELK